MANEIDEGGNRREPGIGVALLTVLTMILVMAVLSVLIWVLMVAVAATTGGLHDKSSMPVQSETVIDQKALPKKP